MRNPIHRKKLSRFLALVLTALVVLSISGTAFAQENAVQASGEITPKDNGKNTPFVLIDDGYIIPSIDRCI
jgi:hypothetical protein